MGKKGKSKENTSMQEEMEGNEGMELQIYTKRKWKEKANERGTSSSPPPKKQARESSHSPIKMNKNHPYLKFDRNTKEKERYSILSKLGIGIEKKLSIDTLDELGMKNYVMSSIQYCGLLRVFEMDVGIHAEILMEMLSSFNVNWSGSEEKPISFRLGKLERKMSFDEFGLACGVYAPGCDNFGEDPRKIPFNKNQFWSQLCGVDEVKFKGGVSKISNVAIKEVQVFYKWMVNSILGRHDIDKLTNLDLSMLYCFEERIQCHWGIALALNFERNSGRRSGLLYGGLFATNVAKYASVSLKGSQPHPMEELSLATLKNMKIYKIDGAHHKILKGHQPIQGSKHTATPPKTSTQPSNTTPRQEDVTPNLPTSLPSRSPTQEYATQPPSYFQDDRNAFEEHQSLEEILGNSIWKIIARDQEQMRELRSEQFKQRKALAQLGRSMKWMQEELTGFFTKMGHCFEPPPTIKALEPVRKKKFFMHFDNIRDSDSEDDQFKTNEEGGTTSR